MQDEQFIKVCDHGQWRSICTVCYQTAATADSRDALDESSHECLRPIALDSQPGDDEAFVRGGGAFSAA